MCCKECPNAGVFLTVFSDVRTEYEDLLYKALYSVQIRESMDEKKTPYLNTIYAVRSLLNNWWFITLLISRLLCNNDVVYAVLTCCMCFISDQAFSNLEKEKEYIILLNNNKTHWNCFITCGSFWSINIQDYSSRFNPSIDIAKKIS